jgi:exopolyphosphatase/guanosine-5'-triphosphate,3'-diphosphate pyrophosphatase
MASAAQRQGDPAARPGFPRLALLPGGAEAGEQGERVAAVADLGSNSWRLVVYAYVPGASWRRIGDVQETVRIAEGLEASGALSEAAIERGLETLEMFERYCSARGIDGAAVDAVATSAIRDAANGARLLEDGRALTGFDIRVLSIEQEARYGHLAAVNTTGLVDGVALDLGGGSLQLVRVEGRREHGVHSWPLGAVRISERLLPGEGAVSRKQLKRARIAIRERLEDADWLACCGPHVVGMGGAARNLAGAAQRRAGSPVTAVQGARLQRGSLTELIDELATRPAAERALPGIKPARADIVLGAALVIEAVFERGGFDAMEVTSAGLREGVFFRHRLLEGAEPLLPDVRASSIRNVAIRCGADIRHADHVARLALQLHDSLAAAGAIEPAPDERVLLWAASLLHDVGMAIGYDGHANHSQYVIRNAGIAGFTPREIELAAQIVRHHRKGTPELEALNAPARPGDAGLLARCALMLQIAELLDHGHDQGVREARIVREGGSFALRLTGDDRLARWRLGKRLPSEAVRRVLGRPLVVSAQDGRRGAARGSRRW